MTKPCLIMDQHFRQLEELFRPATFAELKTISQVQGALNWPMEREEFLASLPLAQFVVAAKPALSRAELNSATQLKAVIEVLGTIQTGLDYDACAERGIEVLSCAPGFRYSVADMAVGLMIAGGRGVVEEHERFRRGTKRWRDDNIGIDFSLYGQRIGCIGFDGGRQPIGDMIVHDVKAILSGSRQRHLQTASPEITQKIIRAPLAAG